MILFWSIAAIMVGGALAFVLPPLLGRRAHHGVARDEINIAIYQQRLAELEAGRKDEALDPDQFQQQRKELEKNLLIDITDEEPRTNKNESPRRRPIAAIAVAIGLPILAIGLYLKLGAATLLDQPTAPRGGTAVSQDRRTLETAVEKLASYVRDNPSNTKGWMMLGRAHFMLEHYSQASLAFAKAYELNPEQPDTLLVYAQALALTNNGGFSGRPTELIRKALALQPDNRRALWLAGTAAFQQGDFRQAINHWKKLSALEPNDSEMQGVLSQSIAEAESRLAAVD